MAKQNKIKVEYDGIIFILFIVFIFIVVTFSKFINNSLSNIEALEGTIIEKKIDLANHSIPTFVIKTQNDTEEIPISNDSLFKKAIVGDFLIKKKWEEYYYLMNKKDTFKFICNQ